MKFKKASKITVTIMLVLTLVLAVGATAIGAYASSPVNNNNNANTTVVPQTPSNNNSTNSAEQLTVSSSGILPDHTKDLTLSFDIDNGGIEILKGTSNEIKASYDSEYYNVAITNKNGKWVVKATGKVAMMGKTDDVRVYIPDSKCTMDVDVLDGNFSYALPDNCADKISVTAENAGVDFTSTNQYKNSAISLIATNKDFIKYEPPVYPSYFTKTNTGLEYANGTGENKIIIKLTGYTSVNFLETPTNVNKSNVTGTEGTQKTVLEMEMNANYSSSDPFKNGLLFCVSEDIETLNAEVYFQMDGKSGIVEIKDRNADEVLWSNTWDENVSGDTVTVSLNNLQKEKEYVVRFTGTKINNAVVKVGFDSELVQEKSRPSK